MRKIKPQKLGEILHSVLEERDYLSPSIEAEIIKKWPSIVGDAIAQVTECKEICNKVLYVRVSSASWRQELSYLKEEIIEKVKRKTNSTAVKDIFFC